MEEKKVTAVASVRRRWTFLPCAVIIIILIKLRVIADPNRAARWLADHTMVLELR